MKGYGQWKDACQAYVNVHLPNVDSLWADGDDYDLFEAAEHAFKAGTTPADFIHEIFAEDFASKAYDDDLRRESKRSR